MWQFGEGCPSFQIVATSSGTAEGTRAGMAAGGKRTAEDAADAPPARRPTLTDKLRGGANGTGTSAGKPSGDLGSLPRGGEGSRAGNGRGGVRTFADVATVNGSNETNAPPRVSAGAIKRLGSVKFTGPAAGTTHRAKQENEAAKRAAAAAARAVPATPRGRPFPDLPMDWSIKTAAKFTSAKPMRWIAEAESAAEHHPGIRSFAGAPERNANDDDDDDARAAAAAAWTACSARCARSNTPRTRWTRRRRGRCT